MLTAFLFYMAVGLFVMTILVMTEPPNSRQSWLQLPLCVLLWWLSLGLFIYRTWRRKSA